MRRQGGHRHCSCSSTVQRSAMTASAMASTVIGAINFTSPSNPAGWTTFI
jgi:hypothetical protein